MHGEDGILACVRYLAGPSALREQGKPYCPRSRIVQWKGHCSRQGTHTRISVLLAYWHHLSHHFLSFIPWNLRLIPHDEHKLYLIGGDLPIYDTTPKTVLDCARDGEPSPIAKFVLLMQEVVKLLGVCVNAAARTRTSSVFSAHNRWWYGKDYNFRLHLQASPLDLASG